MPESTHTPLDELVQQRYKGKSLTKVGFGLDDERSHIRLPAIIEDVCLTHNNEDVIIRITLENGDTLDAHTNECITVFEREPDTPIDAPTLRNMFLRCITEKVSMSGRSHIECKLDLWGVTAMSKGDARSEAYRYWLQYYEAGEYNDLLSKQP